MRLGETVSLGKDFYFMTDIRYGLKGPSLQFIQIIPCYE